MLQYKTCKLICVVYMLVTTDTNSTAVVIQLHVPVVGVWGLVVYIHLLSHV